MRSRIVVAAAAVLVALAPALQTAPVAAAGMSEPGKPKVRMYFEPAVVEAKKNMTVEASLMIDSGDRAVYGADALMFFSTPDAVCIDLRAAKAWRATSVQCVLNDPPSLMADAKRPLRGVMKLGTVQVNVGDTDAKTVYLSHQKPGSAVWLKGGVTQKIKVEPLAIVIGK